MGVQHPWRDVLLHNVALHRVKAQLFPEASLPGVSAPAGDDYRAAVCGVSELHHAGKRLPGDRFVGNLRHGVVAGIPFLLHHCVCDKPLLCCSDMS